MFATLRVPTLVIIGSIALAGCAGSDLFGSNSSGSEVTTSSLAPAQAQRVDPACTTLVSRIDTLRRDGVAERVEKAAVGKTATVNVKRDSLAKVAELNKANAEFQSKCSTLPRTAAAPAPVPGAAATAAAKAAPVVAAKAAPAVRASGAGASAVAVPAVASAAAQ